MLVYIGITHPRDFNLQERSQHRLFSFPATWRRPQQLTVAVSSSLRRAAMVSDLLPSICRLTLSLSLSLRRLSLSLSRSQLLPDLEHTHSNIYQPTDGVLRWLEATMGGGAISGGGDMEGWRLNVELGLGFA